MYFLKRLIFAVPLLLVISALAFALVHLAPGGPFDRERAPASPEIERAIKAKYHLDEPVWKQYFRYLGDLAHGDFGVSLKYRNHTVNDIIAQGLPVSMLLGALAFGFAMGVGLPVGLWETPWHMILPPIALGLFFAGKVARLMREGMLNAMQSEFVTAARAKGLGENRLLLRHAFRIAVLPVVSYSGPMLADLLTGSFVIENIFQIPGIGVFLVNSSLNLDYPLIVGLSLLYAILLIGLNLVVDFAYTLLDPRVKYE